MTNHMQRSSLLACPLCGSTIPHGESLTHWHATAHSVSFKKTRMETEAAFTHAPEPRIYLDITRRSWMRDDKCSNLLDRTFNRLYPVSSPLQNDVQFSPSVNSRIHRQQVGVLVMFLSCDSSKTRRIHACNTISKCM